MDFEGSYWFLEHLSSGKKIILQSGENSLGRHSSCKFILKDYDFLSRRHAIINVNNGNDVNLQVMNALNGVFINGVKLNKPSTPLSAGDIIGLGVDVDNVGDEVPTNYGIFVLKQTCPKVEDMVILSDGDDDDVQILETNQNSANLGEIKMDHVEPTNADDFSDKNPINSGEPRGMHLPMLPDLKQELLTKTSKEIEDIFGDPNEELLESVYQINPYIYKRLNNKNIVTASKQIHDGDTIEVSEDTDASEIPASQVISVEDEDDDYDEHLAMSQAVLREMKDEAADVLFDLNDENSVQFENDFEPPEFKTAIATELDDDEIILLEDDDAEFYDKAAGWSSKLLSQNVMSQIYHLDENDQLSDEDDVEKQTCHLLNDLPFNDDTTDVFVLPVSLKRKSTALRIDSSNSEDESNLADRPTPNQSTLSSPKDCELELSNNYFPTAETKQKSIAAHADLQENNQGQVMIPEVESVSHKKSIKKATHQKSTICKRRTTICARSELEDKNEHLRSVAHDHEKKAKKSTKTSTKIQPLKKNLPEDKKIEETFNLSKETLSVPEPDKPIENRVNHSSLKRSKSNSINNLSIETKQNSLMPQGSKSIAACPNLQDKNQREVILPKSDSIPHKKSVDYTTQQKRRKTISSRSELQDKNEDLPKSLTEMKSDLQDKNQLEIPEAESVRQKIFIEKTNQQKSRICMRRKTISSRSELKDINEDLPESLAELESSKKSTTILEEKPIKSTRTPIKIQTPKTTFTEGKKLEEKLILSKEIDSVPENSSNVPINERPSTTLLKNDNNVQEILIIEPPHLPKHRGKLRGVSAGRKETRLKSNLLEKQRMLNYQVEMKSKWYLKPKDKKRECEEIKQKRREQLKKLAEEKKTDPVSDTVVKRTQTSVPSFGNCNRGEFLTKEVQSTNKKTKPDIPKVLCPMKRRATIESFSQQLNAADALVNLPVPTTRLRERKDAQVARNQRTCNRVTFADMDRDFELRLKRDMDLKRQRRVRFNDNVQIRIIDRVEGADIKVGSIKDTAKLSLSTYSERREYFLQNSKQRNFSDIITGDILQWANQWLSLGSVDELAESSILVPIPTEFNSYKQYKDIMFPLMKIELLATIEREYQSSNSTFEVLLRSHSKAESRNRPRYVLVTRYNQKFIKKFDLYTLRSGNILKETFASISGVQRITENMFELTFEILQTNITVNTLDDVKTITVRPVIDNIRVEKGAFNAVHQLQRSPLFQRILQPSDNDLSCDNKTFKKHDYKGFHKLNEQQKNICLSTWHRLVDDSSPSITLIQGPPGTGKSELIVNLTLQSMYGSINHILDRKILICAHSNTAVDNITNTLNHTRKVMRNNRFELLRFGIFERMDPKVHEVSLSKYLSDKCTEKRKQLLTPEITESLKMQYEQLKKEIGELAQRSHEVNYINQLMQTKQRQLRLIKHQMNPPLTQREEWEYSRMFLNRANIVCTTLSSCVKMAAYIDYFDACIIDEATQCTEPWTLLPLSFGIKDLVLVGDTQQLPATVFSKKAIDCGLNNSMFDRIQRNLKQQMEKPNGKHFVHTKVFKLTKQYRMHPDICKWPNSYFYDNQLENAEITQRLHSLIIPYCVINLSYTRDTNDAYSRSISNDEEARFVAKLLVELDKHMPTNRFKYGLITPYSNQCYTLSQVIPSSMKIMPQTIDAYQGQQRDVIILSNARTRGVGFLTNYQRLNVAITRPRRCLIICGNFDDLQDVDLWRDLLNDARERKVYFDLQRSDVEELEQTLINKMLTKSIQID